MGKREGEKWADGERCCGTKEADYVGCGSKENRSSPTAEMGRGQSFAEESRLDIGYPYKKRPANPSRRSGLICLSSDVWTAQRLDPLRTLATSEACEAARAESDFHATPATRPTLLLSDSPDKTRISYLLPPILNLPSVPRVFS